LRQDPSYPPRFKEAQARAAQALEDEAVRRAHEGLRKPILYKGKPVRDHGQMPYETEYSDPLLALLLKANNPDKFKDKTAITVRRIKSLDDLDEGELRELEIDLLKRLEGLEGQAQLPAGSVIETTAEVV
jgi:hypothetical protein